MNIKNMLLYAGSERMDYLAVRDAIWKSNRKNLTSFSAIASCGLAILLVGTNFSAQLAQSRTTYIVCLVITLLLTLVSDRVADKIQQITCPLVYVFCGLLLAFGIDLGTFVEPNQASASYGILLFAVPLLFTDIPLRMCMMSISSACIYFIFARMTQTPEMFAFNLSVIVPYGIVSLIVSGIMMQVKVERHVLEYKNRILSESDQLSGMLNRRSYEQHVNVLRKHGYESSLKVCAFDVNGLKTVNDTLGHSAGDELICGAANCITDIFGPYGKCYRIGGDEFMAILESSSPSPEKLSAELDRACSEFKGTMVKSLSISVGIETAISGEPIDVIMARADKAMYASKAEYYKNAGIDRRRH